MKETDESEGLNPSSRRLEQAVKESAPARHPRTAFRHLEGWQAGAVAVWIAVMAAALAVPRPSIPADLPAPLPDRRALVADHDELAQLAEQARARPLPFEVRAVGELLRRYGKAEASGNSDELGALLADLRRAAGEAARRHPVTELEKLRAVQTELFTAALAAWEESGQPSNELAELGGNLLERARRFAWIEDGRLAMTPVERAVAFRVRWAELTGLRQRAPFMPSLDDWRVYYGFLLEHPEGRAPVERTRQQLGYVAALAKRDPTYPKWLARGVLQYRLGAFHEAADAFSAHLAEHPEGAYALRARNHLLAALAKAEGRE